MELSHPRSTRAEVEILASGEALQGGQGGCDEVSLSDHEMRVADEGSELGNGTRR